MLRRGLRLVNVADFKQNRRMTKTNVDNFISTFGKNPIHLCRVWRDLQTTTIPEAFMPEEEARAEESFMGFMMANNFMKVYSSHQVRANLFQGQDVTLTADLSWYFVHKIAGLKHQKIVFPANFNETFIGSLDGTHTSNNEPRDPAMRKDPKNYSHKFKMPGLNHEICLDLWANQCIHAKTADKASVHDLTAFRMELWQKIPPGCRLICDRGYICYKNGENDVLAFPNPLDSADVYEFKNRARARHENFNARLKDYGCLRTKFIHGVTKLQICFDAVLVMVQYAIEDTSPTTGQPLHTL